MIQVIWPTVRPKVAAQGYMAWLHKATDPNSVKFHLLVNTQQEGQELHACETESKLSGLTVAHEVVVIPSTRQGVTFTATRMLRMMLNNTWQNYEGRPYEDQDIFVLASDDFTCEPGWDEHLRNQYNFSWNGVLIVNDCYPVSTNIIPMPVVSGSVLRRLNGILYNPAFFHFYSDEELFYIATELKLIKNLRGTPSPEFKHLHWTFGGRKKDSFDERNNARWDADKKMYEARKALPVEEKLKLPEWWAE